MRRLYSVKQRQLVVNIYRSTMAGFLAHKLKSRSAENCSICLEVVKNRRRLPCLHAFCLKCLERHCAGKLPGDDVLCPLCRRTCPFPQHGLDDWKDGQDHGQTTTCEVCSTPAKAYCVNCSQLLCERCSLPHKKMPGGSHTVRQLDKPDPVGFEADDFPHQQSSHLVACRRALLQVESERQKFLDSMNTTKQQVKERGEMVKRIVDGHVNDLLTQIDEMESATTKEADGLTKVLKVALSRAVGAEPSQETRTESAEELMMLCIIASCFSAPDVAFIARDIDKMIGDEKNIVGTVLKTDDAGQRFFSCYFILLYFISG